MGEGLGSGVKGRVPTGTQTSRSHRAFIRWTHNLRGKQDTVIRSTTGEAASHYTEEIELDQDIDKLEEELLRK